MGQTSWCDRAVQAEQSAPEPEAMGMPDAGLGNRGALPARSALTGDRMLRVSEPRGPKGFIMDAPDPSTHCAACGWMRRIS
jgi:hypothetical protein